VSARIICGDCLDVLKTLPAESVNCCVTSPPYWGLRSYVPDDSPDKPLEIGLDATPEAYVARLVEVFREVRRALTDDGTLWCNLGDSYMAAQGGRQSAAGLLPKSGTRRTHGNPRQRDDVDCSSWSTRDVTEKVILNQGSGLKPKDLVGIPWRVAFALQADGWYLRQDIIWHKPNPMPESVRDRCTKAHEYMFLLSKSARYYYDAEAVKEDAQHPEIRHKSSNKSDAQEAAFHGRAPTNLGRCGTSDDGKRNRRDVWTVATHPYKEAHFATFPPDLIRPCVRAGCPAGGTVLDPFAGAGTTGLVALEEGRDFLGIELNPEYVGLIEKRLAPLLAVRTLDCFFEEGAEA